MPHFNANIVHSPARVAKDFQKLLAFSGREEKLSRCQEMAARHLGYWDWFDLKHNGDLQRSRNSCLLATADEFGLSQELARYLMTTESQISVHTGTLSGTFDAIVDANGFDHFMISLNEHSPNHCLLTFGDGRYEPIHRPALFKCLQQLWERTPARPLGDTFKHSYYIGGRRRWLIDVFVDCLVLVRPLSS